MIPTARAFDVFSTFSQGAPIPTTVGGLVSRVLPNVIVAAGVVFFLLIIFFGIGVIKAAGATGDAKQTAQAKAALTWSIIGFLLVVSAFFILQITETLTGLNFINPKI